MYTKFKQYYASVILYHVEKDIIIRVGGGLYLSFGTLWEEELLNIPLSDPNRQIFRLTRLRDFVVSSTNLYIWRSGVYI